MSPTFPEMPYGFAALEPAMSRDALVFHFARHRSFFDRTAAFVRGTPLDSLDLQDVVRISAREPQRRTMYRQAAEAWSHNFLWKSMRPGGGGMADGSIGEAIQRRFGTYDMFVCKFTDAAATVFGSGWLWLTWKADGLQILTTTDAETPIVQGHAPFLALDLWEHAYYLDHQNRRNAYIAAFLEELVDWDFASRNLEARTQGAQVVAVLSANLQRG